MSAYAVHELSFDLPAATVARADGGFTSTDTDVIGRWVERGTGNTVVLVRAGQRPLGVITRVDNRKVAVAVGPVLKGKRGGDTALANGARITGATRKESATGATERGFVNAAPSTAAGIDKGSGYVIDGGAAGTANTPATDVEVLMYH